MGITFTGITSGIDYGKMIDSLVKVARKPQDVLKTKKTDTEALQEAYYQLNTKMLAFETAANAINFSTEFASRKVSSGDTTKLTATATGDATTGSHTISINQLAQAEVEMHSGKALSTTVVNSSGLDKVFEYTYSGTTRSLTIADGTTLEGLRDAINGDSGNTGVIASILDDGSGGSTANHLVITNNNPGYANNIVIGSGTTLSGFSSSGFSETQTARSAVIGVDGYPANYAFTAEYEAYSTAIALGDTISPSGAGNREFVFTYGTNTYTVSMTGGTAYTLQNLKDVINDTATVAGMTIDKPTDGMVSVNHDGTYFNIRGADKGVAITVTSATTLDGTSLTVNFKDNMSHTNTGQGGQTAAGIVSSTNNPTVVTGITMELVGTTTTNVSLTVTNDTESMKKKIKDFVASYNDVMKLISDKTKYDATLKKGEIFFSETVPYTIQGELQSIMMGTVSGLTGTITSLPQMGFNTQKDWTLKINESTLSTVLAGYTSEVIDVMSKNGITGTEGIAQQLSDKLFALNSTVDGYITIQKDSLKDKIKELDQKIFDKEAFLLDYETRLTNKFASLEARLVSYNKSGSLLTSQIAQWNK